MPVGEVALALGCLLVWRVWRILERLEGFGGFGVFAGWQTAAFQGSKDKLGPNRGPGRFQPKDKAGLVNFEEEQFLEVSWLLRLADRVWPGNRFLRSQPSASKPLQGKLLLPFPPFI